MKRQLQKTNLADFLHHLSRFHTGGSLHRPGKSQRSGFRACRHCAVTSSTCCRSSALWPVTAAGRYRRSRVSRHRPTEEFAVTDKAEAARYPTTTGAAAAFLTAASWHWQERRWSQQGWIWDWDREGEQCDTSVIEWTDLSNLHDRKHYAFEIIEFKSDSAELFEACTCVFGLWVGFVLRIIQQLRIGGGGKTKQTRRLGQGIKWT